MLIASLFGSLRVWIEVNDFSIKRYCYRISERIQGYTYDHLSFNTLDFYSKVFGFTPLPPF